MKRKTISIIASILAVIMLSSCATTISGKSDPDSSTPTQRIAASEKLFTVDVTIPGTWFEEGKLNIDDYTEANGFNKAVQNADGSVTITMTKTKYETMISKLSAGVSESLQSLIGGKGTEYVQQIEFSDDFRKVTVNVDRTGYDNAMLDLTPFSVGIICCMYQIFTTEGASTTVIMKYSDTDEEIGRAIYPDAFSNNSSDDTGTSVASGTSNDYEESQTPPISISDIELTCEILPPDSSESVYAVYSFINNSDKTIVGFNLTILLADSNKKVYGLSNDTVLKGETSPDFNSFGPQSGNYDDLQLLKFDITVLNDDGTKTYVTYDSKLQSYEWTN